MTAGTTGVKAVAKRRHLGQKARGAAGVQRSLKRRRLGATVKGSGEIGAIVICWSRSGKVERSGRLRDPTPRGRGEGQERNSTEYRSRTVTETIQLNARAIKAVLKDKAVSSHQELTPKSRLWQGWSTYGPSRA